MVLGEGTKRVALAGGLGPDSKGLTVDVVVDFGANILTWQCRNRDDDKLYGPFTVAFEGTALGLDAMSFFVRDPGCELDKIYVRNF